MCSQPPAWPGSEAPDRTCATCRRIASFSFFPRHRIISYTIRVRSRISAGRRRSRYCHRRAGRHGHGWPIGLPFGADLARADGRAHGAAREWREGPPVGEARGPARQHGAQRIDRLSARMGWDGPVRAAGSLIRVPGIPTYLSTRHLHGPHPVTYRTPPNLMSNPRRLRA